MIDAVQLWLFRRHRLPHGRDLVYLLPQATLSTQSTVRLLQSSSTPSLLVKLTLGAAFHLGACFVETLTAPTSDLVVVKCLVVLVFVLWSKDLVVISLFTKDQLVIWLSRV
jgi:hypothetical protein